MDFKSREIDLYISPWDAESPPNIQMQSVYFVIASLHTTNIVNHVCSPLLISYIVVLHFILVKPF